MAANTAIIGRVAVRVMPDTSDFRKDTERALNAMEKSLRINIPTTANLLGARRDVLQGVRDISKTAPKIRLHTEVARESLAAAAADVEQLRQRVSPVRVDVDVERGVAERAAAALGGVLDVVRRLASSGAQLGAVATGVAGISIASLAGASNLSALSVSLAQLGGLFPVLPGLLGGIAIGFGVMVAALKDFNTVFPDVKASLAEMQNQISAKFWEQAQAPIRTLIDTLLPQLSAGFASTASALGGYFGSLASSLTGAFDGALAGMFADLSKSIEIATGGTGALAGIIRTLGEVGAGYLPRLATSFVDITTRFDGFLSKAAADGRLAEWVENGVTALKDLGSILASTFEILNGIATAAAAAGGSSLSLLADGLQRVADVVSGPAFQVGLTQVFAAAHEALNQIGTLSGPAVSAFFASLGQTLTALLPIAGEALGTALAALAEALGQVEVRQAVVAMFDAILAAVQALAPLLPPLAAVLGTVLAAAFTAVGVAVQAVSGLLTEHTTTATILAGVLTAVVVPALAAWGVASVLNNVKAAAAWIATALAAQSSATVQTTSAAQVAFAWITKAAAATLNAAKVVAGWVATGAAAVASGLVHVAQVAVQVAAWVLLGVQSLLAAAKVAAAWRIAMGPIGLVIAAVVGLVALIVANWDTIKRVTVELWNSVTDKTSGAWKAVKTAVSNGVDSILGFVESLPGKIKGAFSSAGSLLLDAGRAIIDGLLSGLRAGFNKVKSALGELTSMLPDWKGPELAAVWRKPDVLVALTSLTFCAVALAIALVCLRLHKRARSQLLEAQQDVQRLERLNRAGSRSHLMLEESIGHILLAWSGSSASVRALDRTMPRNNVVKSAVRELQSRGSLSSTGLKGAHSLIERANTALARVEAEIGPDRVEQTITLSFTTRGERVVTTAPAVEDGPQRAP